MFTQDASLALLHYLLASSPPRSLHSGGKASLPLAASAVTIQGIASSRVLSSLPSPAHAVSQALFLRRRLQPAAALSPNAIFMIRLIRVCASYMLKGTGTC